MLLVNHIVLYMKVFTTELLPLAGEMIISNDKYLMSEEASSYYSVTMKLLVRNFQKTDLGGYKCISKNSIGDAEGNIRLYGRSVLWRKFFATVLFVTPGVFFFFLLIIFI